MMPVLLGDEIPLTVVPVLESTQPFTPVLLLPDVEVDGFEEEEQGVILAPCEGGRFDVAWSRSMLIGEMRPELLQINMRVAAGRSAALRELAELCGHPDPAPSWLHLFGERWSLRLPGRTLASSAFVSFEPHKERRPTGGCVPSLAGLDPLQRDRLDDGFRWVDAEALARTLLHMRAVAER